MESVAYQKAWYAAKCAREGKPVPGTRARAPRVSTWERKKSDPVWRAKKNAKAIAHYSKIRTSALPYRPTGRPGGPPGPRGPRPGTAEKRAAREAEAAELRLRKQRAHWLYLANQIPGCLTPQWCKRARHWVRPEDYRVSSASCVACRRARNAVRRKRVKAEDPDAWRIQHRLAKHRRRALLKGNGGTVSPAEWRSILVVHDNRCARCGNQGDMTQDHILPISMGGRNVAANLQPMCHLCNSMKGATVTGATQTFLTGILTYAR